MGKVWRLIIHGELSPKLNMDIDEALLQAHARGECPPTLRFYRWSPPAVSLGYFQKEDGISGEALEKMGFVITGFEQTLGISFGSEL